MALGGPGQAQQSVENFYRGKTIDLYIGFTVGGGYDLYARLVGKYMGDHIPGKPRIVPRNMTGAGSRIAAGYIYSVAPKDGAALHGLYSFSENFGGSNGHLQRKALYGPQWLKTADGEWHEQLTATFSHDGTGKTARLDRFMGVENGKFFLSQGGFVPGFSKFGDPFTRPASKAPPVIDLPLAPKAP